MTALAVERYLEAIDAALRAQDRYIADRAAIADVGDAAHDLRRQCEKVGELIARVPPDQGEAIDRALRHVEAVVQVLVNECALQLDTLRADYEAAGGGAPPDPAQFREPPATGRGVGLDVSTDGDARPVATSTSKSGRGESRTGVSDGRASGAGLPDAGELLASSRPAHAAAALTDEAQPAPGSSAGPVPQADGDPNILRCRSRLSGSSGSVRCTLHLGHLGRCEFPAPPVTAQNGR